MTDKEKVIKGLELCIEQGLSDGADCSKCPYYTTSARLTCWMILLYNAHELLKEQDGVEPQIILGIPVFNPHTGLEHDIVCKCGNCGMPLIGKANYCFKCGRKVKWDA